MFLFFLPASVFSQIESNVHEKWLDANSDTIFFDSLSIIPNSFLITDSLNNVLADSLYFFNSVTAELVLKYHFNGKVKIKYRRFPYFLGKRVYNKSDSLIQKKITPYKQSELYHSEITKDENNFFNNAQIISDGSISRALRFGSNSDLALGSDMNLSLAGTITDNIDFIAAISDDNIPIQADGTTAHLQEFNTMFMQISSPKLIVRLGDLDLQDTSTLSIKYDKKIRGAYVLYNDSVKKLSNSHYKSKTSGGIKKGSYKRMKFNGQEGNQGPYQLVGSNNETYVIVLSGSEKVYINGVLLKRGAYNDYTINYNTGQLFFTSNYLISSDSRIIVEFQYIDQVYNRYFVEHYDRLSVNKSEYYWNYYSEIDSKTNVLLNGFNDRVKNTLYQSGDSINEMYIESAIPVNYNSEELLYRKKDTVINSVIYNDIYEYLTIDNQQAYRVRFTYVGENNGSYKQVKTTVNGKVFEWTAPDGENLTGDYEPIVQLIAPVSKNVFILGLNQNLYQFGQIQLEYGAMITDLNTYSEINDNDNLSNALKLKYKGYILGSDSSKYNLALYTNLTYLEKAYQSPKSVYEPEYERKFNLDKLNGAGERMFSIGFISKLSQIQLKYNYTKLSASEFYIGNRHEGTVMFQNMFNETKLHFSNLVSKNNEYNTDFSSIHANTLFELYFMKIGFNFNAEINLWRSILNDVLIPGQENYIQYQAFVENSENLPFEFIVKYQYRKNKMPHNNKLLNYSFSDDFSVGAKYKKLQYFQFYAIVNYRNFKYLDKTEQMNVPQNSLISSADIRGELFNHFVSYSIYNEFGTGLQEKINYVFVKVINGQGTHIWKDYNNNGIKEIDEFEESVIPYEADYIKIYSPSGEYEKIYSKKLKAILRFNYSEVFKSEKILSKLFNKINHQLSFNTEQKTYDFNIKKWYYTLYDTVLTNSLNNYQSNIRYNNNTKPLIQFLYLHRNQKLYLSYGFDYRFYTEYKLNTAINFYENIIFKNNYSLNNKRYNSDFFQSKSYDINTKSVLFELSINLARNNKLIINYQYKQKNEAFNAFNSYLHKSEISFNKSLSDNSIIKITGSYINNLTNYNNYNSVSYEMLEGLSVGKNYLGTMQLISNLGKNLQLELYYHIRKAEQQRFIQTGNIQLRALF